MAEQLSNDRYQSLRNDIAGATERTKSLEISMISVLQTVGEIKGTLPAPAKKTSPWLAPPVIVASLSVVATFCTLLYNTHKVDKLNTKISHDLDDKGGIKDLLNDQAKREANLETSVRLLTATTAPQLLHELDKCLEASSRGQREAASSFLLEFNDRIQLLSQAQAPAEQPFFTDAALKLDKLALLRKINGTELTKTRQTLAAYHSAVLQPADLTRIFAPASNTSVSSAELSNLSSNHAPEIGGVKVYRSNYPMAVPTGLSTVGDGGSIIVNMRDGDLFTVGPDYHNGLARLVSGVILVTPNQTLDDIVWRNVVFVNAHIRFNGGSLTLQNVRFVNCTFEITSSEGEPILNYAINDGDKLVINSPAA